MKKYWKFIPLLALVLIILTGCGKEEPGQQPQTDAPEDSETVSVSALHCSDGSSTLRFSLDEGGHWCWFDDPSFPLDDTMIVAALESIDTMEGRAVSKGALDKYGFSNSKKYFSLTVGDDTVTYQIGKKEDTLYCAAQSDERTVYPVPDAVKALMNSSIYDLAMLPQFPKLTAENIRSVEIRHGKSSVTLTMQNGKWTSDDKVSEQEATALGDALANLSFDRCVDYAPSKGVASICGLKKPAAKMTVTYGGDSENHFTLTIGDTYKEGRFALLDGDTTVYQLSNALAEPILAFAKN